MNNFFSMSWGIVKVMVAHIRDSKAFKAIDFAIGTLIRYFIGMYAAIRITTDGVIFLQGTSLIWNIPLYVCGVVFAVVVFLIFNSSIWYNSVQESVLVVNQRVLKYIENLKIDSKRKGKASAYWSRKAKNLHNMRRVEEKYVMEGIMVVHKDEIMALAEKSVQESKESEVAENQI